MLVTVDNTSDGSFVLIETDNQSFAPVPRATLQAIVEPITGNAVGLRRRDSDVFALDYVPFADLVKLDSTAWGIDARDAANNLNAHFTISAPVLPSMPSFGPFDIVESSPGVAPVDLTAPVENALRIEYTSVPADLIADPANNRRIVGNITGGVGAYSVQFDASNAVGSVSLSYTINVISGFTYTASTFFKDLEYIQALPQPTPPLARPSDAGATPWSMMWQQKPGPNTSNKRGIVTFGSFLSNQGRVLVEWIAGARKIRLTYGISAQSSNRIQVETPNGSLTRGQWHTVLVCYDGGPTTNRATAEAAGRFAIYIDGVAQTLSWSGSGYGNDISSSQYYIGTSNPSNRNSGLVQQHKLASFASWDIDQRANAAAS